MPPPHEADASQPPPSQPPSQPSSPTAPPATAAAFPLRTDVREADREAIREIVAATGFFHPGEIDVAVELADEYLLKGPRSGYQFIFAEAGGRTVGYACFGHISVTVFSYDLYWIAVHPASQGQGVGRLLLDHCEQMIRSQGGRRIYVETSGRAAYAATRAFYERCGYSVDVVQREFYAPGDDKIVYVKVLDESTQAERGESPVA